MATPPGRPRTPDSVSASDSASDNDNDSNQGRWDTRSGVSYRSGPLMWQHARAERTSGFTGVDTVAATVRVDHHQRYGMMWYEFNSLAHSQSICLPLISAEFAHMLSKMLEAAANAMDVNSTPDTATDAPSCVQHSWTDYMA